MEVFLRKRKFYVYVPKEEMGYFVVKGIFLRKEMAEEYARNNNGFIEETFEEVRI